MQEKEQDYAKKSFDDVAHKYDEILFFKTSARHVVEIIKREKGEDNALNILDVACGTGNVVLECAVCMPNAKFMAVDISEGMLAKARANAESKKLDNIDFKLQDITAMPVDKKYDLITCSYALFFLAEAHEVLASLVSLLHKDGIVIFTSFRAKAFSPSNEILLPLLRKYGSKSAIAYDMDKWENLKQIKDIEYLCKLAKVNTPQIQSKAIRYGMSLDEWWELLNNTGYKGMLMELNNEDYDRVQNEYYEAMYKHADMDGEVELVADSWFVVVKG
jgi:ubiquinone/menaquinone biosynthesis C-methylase UbiE